MPAFELKEEYKRPVSGKGLVIAILVTLLLMVGIGCGSQYGLFSGTFMSRWQCGFLAFSWIITILAFLRMRRNGLAFSRFLLACFPGLIGYTLFVLGDLYEHTYSWGKPMGTIGSLLIFIGIISSMVRRKNAPAENK